MRFNSAKKWLSKNSKNKNVLAVTLMVFVIGLFSGWLVFSPKSNAEQRPGTAFKNYSESQSEEVNTQQGNKPTEREAELLRILNDQGEYIDSDTETFDKENFGFYHPQFEGKEVEVTTYKYKSELDESADTIIQRRIELENYITADVWQYFSVDHIFYEPEDFVIFGGYENYLNTAIHVNEIVESWDESYVSNGQNWFYRYHYAPKWIGSVSLNLYRPDLKNSREPIPSFITIRKGGFLVENERDPEALQAKEDVKSFVDTIVFDN